MLSEFVATFGLLAVIQGCARRRADAVPFAVSAYITAAYWFTASTSFANPAVTLAQPHRHVCRRPSRRCPRFHRGAGGWRDCGHRPVPLDRPGAPAGPTDRRRAVPVDAARRRLYARGHPDHEDRTVRMRPQCRALADGGRLVQRLAGPTRARAISAGTQPGTQVHPEVIAAMQEVGIDLTGAATTRLTPDVAGQAQVLVTMGCGDECPVVPAAKRDDWPRGSEGPAARRGARHSGRGSRPGAGADRTRRLGAALTAAGSTVVKRARLTGASGRRWPGPALPDRSAWAGAAESRPPALQRDPAGRHTP